MLAMEQTLHVNPTREDRKSTNTSFVWIFGFIIFVWLVVVIKVLVGGPYPEVDQNTNPTSPTIEDVSPQDFDTNDQTTYSTIEDESSQKFDENYQTDFPPIKSEPPEVVDKDDHTNFQAQVGDEPSLEVDDDYHTLSLISKAMTFNFSGSFLLLAVLSGAIALGYIYFLSLPQGKFVIYGAMGLLCLWIVHAALATLFVSFLLLFNMFYIILVIPLLIYGAYLVISFLCARGAGVNAIFEIIKDSSRALICSPTILLLVLAISFIIVLILIFTVYIADQILLSKSGVYIFIGLNVFGAKALINFFVNLIHMVISEYAVDWFWTKDHHSSSFTIRRSFSKIFSYHLGTVAYASIPILSYMASIFQVSKCRDSDKDVIKIYNIYTRVFSQLSVTLYVTDYALVQTSIYGYDYGTAIMAAHDIVAQNNHEINLAVSEVSIAVTTIGTFFITLPFSYLFVQYSLYSPAVPFVIAFTSAVHALLVNKMIIKYTSDALQEDCELTQKTIEPETPVDV